VAEAKRAEPPKPKPKPKPRPERYAWSYPEEAPDGGTSLRFGPAVDDKGRAFLHVGEKLVALTEEDGKPTVAWDYVTGSRVPGPVVLVPDGTLRFHAADGMLHALEVDSGRQVYAPVNVGEPLGYAAPVTDAEGNTYISIHDGGLLRVDPDGEFNRARPYLRTRQILNSMGVIHDGVLYLGSDDGYVFAIELGENSGKNRFDHTSEQGHAGWFINTALAIAADGTLIVASRDDHLYGFSPAGKTKFKTPLPGQVLGAPVLDQRGNICVGITINERGKPPAGKLISIDGNSHKIRWQFDAAGPVESTPVVAADGVIYFGDNTGLIHAVDGQGQLQWKSDVGQPVRSAGTMPREGRIAFGLEDETLIVLECDSPGLADGVWPKLGRTLAQSGLS